MVIEGITDKKPHERLVDISSMVSKVSDRTIY
jgi:hypothetical protein